MSETFSAGMSFSSHIEQVCQQSSLCAQLVELFEGIKKTGIANLTFNNDIDMSVLLHTELFEPSQSYMSMASPSAFSPAHRNYNKRALLLHNQTLSATNNNHRLHLMEPARKSATDLLDGPSLHLDIAPWQSLLPLQDPDELIAEVDEVGLLVRFLEIMSPT